MAYHYFLRDFPEKMCYNGFYFMERKISEMKLKDGVLLRQVAGQTVVLPTGDDLDLNMMITLNDTGKFLWERLAVGAEEADLVKDLLAEYDVTEEVAASSVAAFVARLKELDFLA